MRDVFFSSRAIYELNRNHIYFVRELKRKIRWIASHTPQYIGMQPFSNSSELLLASKFHNDTSSRPRVVRLTNKQTQTPPETDTTENIRPSLRYRYARVIKITRSHSATVSTDSIQVCMPLSTYWTLIWLTWRRLLRWSADVCIELCNSFISRFL